MIRSCLGKDKHCEKGADVGNWKGNGGDENRSERKPYRGNCNGGGALILEKKEIHRRGGRGRVEGKVRKRIDRNLFKRGTTNMLWNTKKEKPNEREKR